MDWLLATTFSTIVQADKIHSVHHEESNVAKVTAEKADVIPTDHGPDHGPDRGWVAMGNINHASKEHDDPLAAVAHPELYHDVGQDLKVGVEQPA